MTGVGGRWSQYSVQATVSCRRWRGNHQVLIRAWAETDERSVGDFLATLVDQDASISPQVAVHGPDQDLPRPLRRTLVAIDQDDVVGLGTLWENSLHPARWRVTLHGYPPFWSSGPASALVA